MTVLVVDAQPLATAIKAAITGIAVGEGVKPSVAAGAPYVVVWFDSGRVTDKSLRSRDGFDLVAVFQCYGGDPDAVRFGIRKVREAAFNLADATVGGRTVQMPEHGGAPPMQRDDKAQPPLWWQSDEWRFRTT